VRLATHLYTRNVVAASSLAEDLARSSRISLVRAGDGADAVWLAEVEDMPGCSATAATPEDAVRRAWAAAEESLGTTYENPRRSGKLLVRMPATLHDDLARVAESEGVSLNQLITGVLAGAVEWRSSEPSLGSRNEPATRLNRIALLANFAVVLLAAAIAVAVLVAALQG
jgi:predicted RNase H-like HicB family nuclease